MILKGNKENSVSESRYVFLGFNNRYREFGRKYLLENYFKSLDTINSYGQFYLKYFDWYMTPICVSLEELEFC